MSRRTHNALSGLVAAFACLVIVVTLVATWTYATLLNSGRFVGTVSAVTSDPAVIASASDKLATQVVEGFQIQSRLEAILPDRIDGLAAQFADAVQERIAAAVETGLSSDRFQGLWESALETMHARLLALLRGEAPNAELANGVLTIDLLGVINEALHQLQADGVIDASVQLPDWSGEESRQATIDVLNRTLTLTLPPDFGEIEVTNVAWLEGASAIVRAADIAVVILAVLSVGLAALALWLMDRRKRAALIMTAVIVLALLGVVVLAGLAGGPLASDVAASTGLALIGAMGSVLAGSLMGWLAVGVIGIAVIGLVVAFLVPNRDADTRPG